MPRYLIVLFALFTAASADLPADPKVVELENAKVSKRANEAEDRDTLLNRLQTKLKQARENSPKQTAKKQPAKKLNREHSEDDELWASSPLRSSTFEKVPLDPLEPGTLQQVAGFTEGGEEVVAVEEAVRGSGQDVSGIDSEDLVVLLATMLKHARMSEAASVEEIRRIAVSLYEYTAKLTLETLGEDGVEEVKTWWPTKPLDRRRSVLNRSVN